MTRRCLAVACKMYRRRNSSTAIRHRRHRPRCRHLSTGAMLRRNPPPLSYHPDKAPKIVLLVIDVPRAMPTAPNNLRKQVGGCSLTSSDQVRKLSEKTPRSEIGMTYNQYRDNYLHASSPRCRFHLHTGPGNTGPQASLVSPGCSPLFRSRSTHSSCK